MKSSITVLLDCLGMAAGGEDADGGKVALLRHWFVSQEQRLSPTLWGPRHRPGDSEAMLPGLVAGVSQQFDHSGLVTASWLIMDIWHLWSLNIWFYVELFCEAIKDYFRSYFWKKHEWGLWAGWAHAEAGGECNCSILWCAGVRWRPAGISGPLQQQCKHRTGRQYSTDTAQCGGRCTVLCWTVQCCTVLRLHNYVGWDAANC